MGSEGTAGRPPRESPDSADSGRDDGVSDEQSRGGRLGDSIPGCVPESFASRITITIVPPPASRARVPSRRARRARVASKSGVSEPRK